MLNKLFVMEIKKYGGCGSDLDKEISVSMKNRQESQPMKTVEVTPPRDGV